MTATTVVNIVRLAGVWFEPSTATLHAEPDFLSLPATQGHERSLQALGSKLQATFSSWPQSVVPEDKRTKPHATQLASFNLKETDFFDFIPARH